MSSIHSAVLTLIERGWQPYSTLAYRDRYINFQSKDGLRFAHNVYHPEDIPMVVEAADKQK